MSTIKLKPWGPAEKHSSYWEQKSAEAEKSGRHLLARRWKERAERLKVLEERAASPEKQREHIRDLVAQAEVMQEISKQPGRSSRERQSSHSRAIALMREASGFSAVAAIRDFYRSVTHVAVGLNQECVDALGAIGVERKDRARFLSMVVQEAIFALEDAGMTKAGSAFGPCFSLSAKQSGRVRREERCRRHVSVTAAAEFAMCAATVKAG